MDESLKDQVVKGTVQQTLYGIGGAVVGALTKSGAGPAHACRGQSAQQIGAAMGNAAARGAGVTGAVAAGAAVVTAKVAAGTAVAVAAAPFALGAAAVVAAGWGLYKLARHLDKNSEKST